MKRAILFCAAIFPLVGCSYYYLVKPGKQNIGDLYRVKTNIAWSRAIENDVEVWTVDGPLLQEVRFISGLADGLPLIHSDPLQKIQLPRFRSHMTPSEVQELFVATAKSLNAVVEAEHLVKGRVPYFALRSAGINASSVQTANLRPTKFGTLPGFRFDASFLSKEGLEFDGLIAGTIHEQRLYLIIYTGTREYYYPKYKDEIEQIISSIEIFQKR